MICSSVNLLFFMSVILLVDGLHELYAGTAGGGQVTYQRRTLAVIVRLIEKANDHFDSYPGLLELLN
jgi:hypothetical protein